MILISGLRILRNLTEMSRLSTDVFRHLFFDSDEYARRCGIDNDKDHDLDVQMDGIGSIETRFRRNEYDTSPMTKILRKKIILRLEDWFSFIEVKSQRNITMNWFVEKPNSFIFLYKILLVVIANFLVLSILFLLIVFED